MRVFADDAEQRQNILCGVQDGLSSRVSYGRTTARVDHTQLLSGAVST